MSDRRLLRYEAELGGPSVQPGPRRFERVERARCWAIGRGRASDCCIVPCGGAVVAEYRRNEAGGASRWYRVAVMPKANGGRRRFFVYGPALERAGLRLLHAIVVRGESEEAVRRRLAESEGYPPAIVVRML